MTQDNPVKVFSNGPRFSDGVEVVSSAGPEPEVLGGVLMDFGDVEDEVSTEPEPAPEAVTPQHVERLEKTFSTREVAKIFFDKTEQWMYWGMRDVDPRGNKIDPAFSYEDGTPIEPIIIGNSRRRMRWTLPMVTDIAAACYRRGNLKEQDLKSVLVRIESARRDELVLS